MAGVGGALGAACGFHLHAFFATHLPAFLVPAGLVYGSVIACLFIDPSRRPRLVVQGSDAVPDADACLAAAFNAAACRKATDRAAYTGGDVDDDAAAGGTYEPFRGDDSGPTPERGLGVTGIIGCVFGVLVLVALARLAWCLVQVIGGGR